ncbi:hypothetical protein [Methylobacter tundripaludum]|uniref:hypothetical protein n=1 Tax=Methylobacter tundripaludum TaxID=173365 RepID=UPI000590AD05|nr:hypothetical protein [Methylobacter tundripaludum]
MADMRLFVNGVMGLSAGAQALAWEFGAGSSSFPSREAATAWAQEVEQRREQLPRASLSLSLGEPAYGSRRNAISA